jgi:hypothetical protein
MGIRIWLDDVREPPDGFDIWCKDTFECSKVMREHSVDFISFDHDLGNKTFTGYSLAVIIEDLAFRNLINPIGWEVHSMNPVGAERIRKAMTKADNYWRENVHNAWRT